jgi:hypothetical protein
MWANTSSELGANWEQDWQYGSSESTIRMQRDSDVSDGYFSICNESQRGSNTSQIMKR